MITIFIINLNGRKDTLKIPSNINLSLMEVLRANGYPILGTCGGIALCATCAVDVLSDGSILSPAGDQELDMLDILPEANATTRLACQIRVSPEIDGLVIRIAGEGSSPPVVTWDE